MILIYVSLSVSLFFCKSEPSRENIRFVQKPSLIDGAGYELLISDSILIEIPEKLSFVDYSKKSDKLLFVSTTNKIILTNLEGEIIHEHDLLGDSDSNFGNMLHHVGFGFMDNIVVVSERGVNQYSQEGNFIHRIETAPMILMNEYKRLNIVPYRGRSVIVIEPQESVMDSRNSLSENMSNFEFFINNYKSRSFVDMKSGETLGNFFGNELGSIFRNLDHRYRDQGFRVFYFKKDSSFYIINNPDQNIYVYSEGLDYELTRTIPLRPDKFRYPLKYSQDEFSVESILESLKYNSNFLSIVRNKEYTLILYRQGIEKSDLTVSVEDAIFQSPNYLMVLDSSGRKLTEDILLPKKISSMFLINDSIYFKSKNENPKYEVFYKGSLKRLSPIP